MSREAFCVYMTTNKGQTRLHIGVTNSMVRRVHQHLSGGVSGFTERYNLNRLVDYAQHNDPRDAIAREKQLKRWRREKKEALIGKMNPTWADLAASVLGLGSAPAPGWKRLRSLDKLGMTDAGARDDAGAKR
ncbi:MAG: GIY-YIG nuclease family protein [Kiritimatiellae bacterium]|nr:GIY-YIG nuclease family protein [Kiritimatiellia bacterium]